MSSRSSGDIGASLRAASPVAFHDKNRSLLGGCLTYAQCHGVRAFRRLPRQEQLKVSKNTDNMAIVGRWFASFWGVTCIPDIVDELAAPDILLQYSLDTPRRGRALVKAFRLSLLAAFPDLHISISGEPVSDRDIVVVCWTANGTHTGPAFNDFNIGPFPAVSGRTVQLAGTNAVRLENGRIVEEAVWLRPCVVSEPAVHR